MPKTVKKVADCERDTDLSFLAILELFRPSDKRGLIGAFYTSPIIDIAYRANYLNLIPAYLDKGRVFHRGAVVHLGPTNLFEEPALTQYEIVSFDKEHFVLVDYYREMKTESQMRKKQNRLRRVYHVSELVAR